MNLLRAFLPSLYDRIQPYKATEEQMPWAYQFANPDGRPYHDDWGVMGKWPWQPWQKVLRRDCAYVLPLPFRCTKSSQPFSREWMLWDETYPLAPGTPLEDREIYHDGKRYMAPHALVDCAGYGWSEFSVFIEGAWVKCFEQYHRVIGGRRFAYYRGLKQDITCGINDAGEITSDLMCWFPEFSMTWIKTEGR